MTPKDQTRLQVLNSFLIEHIARNQAAELMGASPRHTWRILAAYQERGAAALAHGHRGRRPANAIPEATRSRVVHLARTVYEGANHTHLSELLSEREGIDMAGPPCGASWSTLGSAVRGEGARPSTRVFRLLEMCTDEGEGMGRIRSVAAEGGCDVWFTGQSEETDGQVA